MKQQTKQLKLRFLQALQLPNLSQKESMDAYIYTKFQGKEFKTETRTTNNDITEILQEWSIRLAWPLVEDRLRI